MKDRIIITGYSGSLARRTTELLKDNYEIIGLTSNKKELIIKTSIIGTHQQMKLMKDPTKI